MNAFAQQLGIDQNVFRVLVGLVAAMVIGTIVRLTLLRGRDAVTRRKKIGSLLAWWVMVVIFSIASIAGPTAGVVVIGIISFFGLREFLEITEPRFHEQVLRPLALVVLPVHFFFTWQRWHEPFWIFIPAIVFLLVPIRLILDGHTEGFIEKASSVTWGLFLIVYNFSHAALLLTLPAEVNPSGGVVGLFLFLVILTEVNDIAQALWGRKFGRHKVVPSISPNKSWEGLLLGFATTVIVAVLLAPLLTPFSGNLEPGWNWRGAGDVLWPMLAGLLIAIGGFFGDLNMSAVKRDLGIKDAGHLIPGQGGILDRIDSLTFTAPLFFYFVFFLYL